jgi:hypothetical protein
MPLTCNLNDFITDAALIEKIKAAANDPDDPPLIFDWNDDAVQVFLDKMAQLTSNGGGGGDGAVVAPFPLQSPPTVHILKQDLISYIRGLVPGCELLSGPVCTAGLACTTLQYGNACVVLRGLELHPWFVAVLAAGATPLTQPLAKILVPQPEEEGEESTGDCDILSFHCALWL